MSTKRAEDGSDTGTSHLLNNHISHSSGTLLGELRVKPQGQGRMILGNYSTRDPLKGFSIQLTPHPEPDDAVVTQIANAGTAEQYKLLLHVINYGAKTVTAKVWQL